MSVFDDERYNELVSSAFETAYLDEQEKLAGAAQIGTRVLPWLSRLGRIGVKEAPAMAAASGKVAPTAAVEGAAVAAKKPGLIGRFIGRQTHALGLGKSLPVGATPEQIAAYESHLSHIGVPGAKTLTPFEQQAQATKDVGSKWNVGERVKRLVQGANYDKQKAILQQAEALQKQEGGARQMYELTGGTIPGAAKALVTSPLKTMGAGWKSMPTWQKYMMGGFGALQAKELADMEGKTPEEKAETIARSAVMAPLWLGTGGIGGLLPSMGAWMAGEEAAVRGAKAIARATHPEQYPKKFELTPEDVQAIREQAIQEATNR